MIKHALLVALVVPSIAFAQGCPTAAQVCTGFHGPAATPTGGCANAPCYDMSYGEAARFHAPGEDTLFPRTFMYWTGVTPVPAGLSPCVVAHSGNKWKLEIPEGQYRCRADVQVGAVHYSNHIASNPQTSCLGWVECRLP